MRAHSEEKVYLPLCERDLEMEGVFFEGFQMFTFKFTLFFSDGTLKSSFQDDKI